MVPMARSGLIARSDATRPIATRDHRRLPLGWSSVEAAALAGVPKRTVQEWRKTGFFVPALPEEWTSHPPGELYGLSDVLAVRLIRRLLELGVEREAVARFGEEFLVYEGLPWSVRSIAATDPPWWCMVPATVELWDLRDPEADDADEGGLRYQDAGIIEAIVERHREDDNDLCRDDNGVYWRDADGSMFVVWLPITRDAIELASKADHWQRQRRIPPNRWPPCM